MSKNKTMEDYQKVLSEEIDLLKTKQISPVRMKAAVYAVAQFIKSVRTEIEYQKLMGTKEEMSCFKK